MLNFKKTIIEFLDLNCNADVEIYYKTSSEKNLAECFGTGVFEKNLADYEVTGCQKTNLGEIIISEFNIIDNTFKFVGSGLFKIPED